MKGMALEKFQNLATSLGTGRRIREVRAGLTQEKFARIWGHNKSTVSKFESGKLMPNSQTRRKICEFGKVTEEWLLKGDFAPPGRWSEKRLAFGDELDLPRGFFLSPVHSAALAQIIAVMEDLLSRKGLNLTPVRKARLISLLYERFQETGKNPDWKVMEELLRLVV